MLKKVCLCLSLSWQNKSQGCDWSQSGKSWCCFMEASCISFIFSNMQRIFWIFKLIYIYIYIYKSEPGACANANGSSWGLINMRRVHISYPYPFWSLLLIPLLLIHDPIPNTNFIKLPILNCIGKLSSLKKIFKYKEFKRKFSRNI